MSQPIPLWAERSSYRAHRWIERLEILCKDAVLNVPKDDPRRQSIEDYTAACDGELLEIPYKVTEQLSHEYKQAGRKNPNANARQWVKDQLKGVLLVKGLRAVRHLDVHIEGRYSGRMIIAGEGIEQTEWWTHPGVPESMNDLLRPKNRLSRTDLEKFNQQLLKTPLVDVLQAAVDWMTVFMDEAREEISYVRQQVR